MKPFSVILDINTPIQIGPYPIHLDGLLYWLLLERCGEDKDVALKELNSILALKDGVFQASSMAAFLHSSEFITEDSWTYAGKLDFSEYPYPLKSKKIKTNGGAYRSRIKNFIGMRCPKVIFHGVGEIDVVENLLSFCPGIGLNAKRGAGEINAVQIEAQDDDFSWVDSEGRLARILPESVVKHLSIDAPSFEDSITYHPPYNNPKCRARCAVPDFRIIRYK